eukprot:12897335-Prorocentrum_lima.AAC.1
MACGELEAVVAFFDTSNKEVAGAGVEQQVRCFHRLRRPSRRARHMLASGPALGARQQGHQRLAR